MSKNRLFFTKPLPQLFSESKESGGLKRSLTALNLTTLGIGAIIGAGIFVLTGQAAAQYAGPGIVLSFIISGLACGFAGLCYAEFASMIPIAGSAYTYSYATLGEFLAWIIGWDLILEYLFAASTVAVGWSGYVVSFLKDLNIFIPPQFTGAVGTVLVNVPEYGMETSDRYFCADSCCFRSSGRFIGSCYLCSESSGNVYCCSAINSSGYRDKRIGKFQ